MVLSGTVGGTRVLLLSDLGRPGQDAPRGRLPECASWIFPERGHSQPHNLVAADVSPRHLLRSERRLAPTHVGGYGVMGREAAGRSIWDSPLGG